MPYLIKEKKSLEEVILLGKKKNEILDVSDENIHYLVKEYKGNKYLIVVNISGNELLPEIRLKEDINKLKVISEGRNIEVKGNVFKDKFSPYQVHIYTDNLIFKDVIDLNKVKEEIKTEGGWYDYLEYLKEKNKSTDM